MPQPADRTARIEAGLPPDTLRVVKRRGTAAQGVVHRTIDETQVIRLSIEDQQRFVTLLLNHRLLPLP